MTASEDQVWVLDQDEAAVAVTEVHRGHGLTIVHVNIQKPLVLPPEDTQTALAAALLGMNLQRDVRMIAADIKHELDRMGYELRSNR